LDDAVAVARAIHNNAGTSCTLSQLAAFLDQPISSGTFRARVSNAAIFGVTENARREVSLTALGRRIADPAAEPAARVDAFLHVPLYLRIFEHHDGYTLPGAAPLEKFMREVGVSPKQTGRARQAFMRSARQAGFFAHGEDRLVRPSFPTGGPGTRPVDGGSEDSQNKGKRGGSGGGGGGDDGGPRHRLIVGLFESLPPDGTTWTAEEAADWLETAAANLRLVYKFKGRIRVEIQSQRADGDAV
jgi:hypothetical protein